MSAGKIKSLEQEIFKLNSELNDLRKQSKPVSVKNYTFETINGETTLLDLFGDSNTLLAIHNMGQACRYCTLWADGFSPFLPHLESSMSVVLLSKDAPNVQRTFSSSRGWRFHMASHLGGEYMLEQSVGDDGGNHPGAVTYTREGDKIFRKNSCAFGPGDLYCSMWGLLALAGLDASTWTPQYNYWQRPVKLDDGGENVLA